MNSYEQKLKDLEVGQSTDGGKFKVFRVPGGWIYEHRESKNLCFVPIPGIEADTININGDNIEVKHG